MSRKKVNFKIRCRLCGKVFSYRLEDEKRESNIWMVEWTDDGWAKKKWGIKGEVLTHHDSHGLCYDVTHEDGSQACYDPSEIEVITEP